MKTLKTIILFFLLAVLTCTVVFVPQSISGQKEEDVLSETTSRSYSVGSRPKLTSKQVARLYYNREVVVNYYPIDPYIHGSVDNEALIVELIEILFGEDDEVCNYIIETIEDRDFGITRSSTLTKIENQPVALNFVRCYVDNFEIFYEEKTKTILGVSFDFFDINTTDDKEYGFFVSNIERMISKYYENNLGFQKDEWYYFVDFPKMVEFGQDYYLSNLFISCGILQYDDIKAEVVYSY